MKSGIGLVGEIERREYSQGHCAPAQVRQRIDGENAANPGKDQQSVGRHKVVVDVKSTARQSDRNQRRTSHENARG